MSRGRLVIGAMTGTSIDALDLSLVEVHGDGLEMTAKLLRGRSAPLGPLAPRLRLAATQTPLPAREFAELALDLGRLHADEAHRLADRDTIDLVVLHGQTIFHAPPVSWQLINPFPVVGALRCRVLCDLRQADLAVGGQGAPITPLADWILYRTSAPRAVLNLGGFANATALPGALAFAPALAPTTAPTATALTQHEIELIRGADLCICNQLLDELARRALDRPYDDGGAAAQRGTPDSSRCAELEALLEQQRRAGRSLGTADAARAWVERAAPAIRAEDLLATAVAALACVIARGVLSLHAAPGDVVVAGGGARNLALTEAIASHLPCALVTSDSCGIPIEFREAAGIAVLGALVTDGVPITLPAVTGRRPSVALDALSVSPITPAFAADRRPGENPTAHRPQSNMI